MDHLGKFVITPDSSLQFAGASGDFNPLHLDAVAARRTQFGRTLVHGVGATIKCLDLLMQDLAQTSRLVALKVKYSKPVSQGQELAVVRNVSGDDIRLELFADDTRCQVIDLTLAGLPASKSLEVGSCPAPSAEMAECAELTIEDCDDLSGSVGLPWQQELLLTLFPHATRYLPQEQLASLIATTRIVGMNCPGLHSVFAGLELQFGEFSGKDRQNLSYRVSHSDARIDQVIMQVNNAWVDGKVETFFRAPPVRQARFEDILSLVPQDSFSNQKALVIGASRGLGEVITKVLAAGGAQLMMTYATGREDAERVRAEIGQLRTAPNVSHYDVLAGDLTDELKAICASTSHIYYLASPKISKGDARQWNQPLFQRYCNFYLEGLARLLQQVQACRDMKSDLTVFLPSSVFLQEKTRGFAEYIAAKGASEAYARQFEALHSNWRFISPRLPRLHTDQTSGVRGLDEQKTLQVIYECLRNLPG